MHIHGNLLILFAKHEQRNSMLLHIIHNHNGKMLNLYNKTVGPIRLQRVNSIATHVFLILIWSFGGRVCLHRFFRKYISKD